MRHVCPAQAGWPAEQPIPHRLRSPVGRKPQGSSLRSPRQHKAIYGQRRSPDPEHGQFDLIIGADGAGSVVRPAMQAQIPRFTVECRSIPNYVTMIALDRTDS